MELSINERIHNHNCHNPVLRWQTGHAVETIRMESGLIPADENLDQEIDYSDPFAIWGDDCDPNMLDAPMSDDDWKHLLYVVEIQ